MSSRVLLLAWLGLAAAALCAAECAPFCTRVPSEALGDIERCDTCDEVDAFDYDDVLGACEDEACCDSWCRWVPSQTWSLVPRCVECEDEPPVPRRCAAWCQYVPEGVHNVVPPCAGC